jgi:glycosyltransferase involved in cell wall biosynthesis
MTKVSVIIPVYNAEEFLDESINSVLNQTLEDIELICVNDGSKDNSLKMLLDFSKKDKRVKVIDKPNGGCGSARNKALDNATGEFIYFFDPDDYILEDCFEKLYNNAVKNNTDLVMFKIARFRDGEPSNYSIPGFNFDDIFPDADFDNFVFNYKDIKHYVLNASFAPWTKLYRKSFLDKYDDFRFPLGVAFDDVPYHVKSVLRASSISFVPEFFYRYRLSNANSVNNTASNGIGIFRICDIVEEFLRKENFFNEFREEFILFKITQVFNYLISSNTDEYFNKTREEFENIQENF